jgi:2-polyprenyl-6-methoxyphenol hydroxylase-like FAD-dependent oxidoreductase
MLTEMNSSSDGTGHALVIGGSMAGLFAARVLSERFGRVTIVERDSFPEGPQFRKGVPQSRHLHAFMMRGRMISDRLFPASARSSKRRAQCSWTQRTILSGLHPRALPLASPPGSRCS